MGKKKRRQQEDLWVATSELPRTAGHPFYERLNGLFNEHGFDDFVEGLCAKFYADKMGRPSLAARGRSTFSELRWYPPMEAAKGSLSWVFRAKQPESVRTGP